MNKLYKFLRYLLTALTCGAFVVISSGCNRHKEKITQTTLLLDWWSNPNHVPIYVGIEHKIFKKHGIELKILSLQEPPNALAYLLSHQVDVALYYTPHCLMGYARAPDFKIIGKLHEHALYTFACRQDSNITHLEDFQGKTLGVFGDSLSKGALRSLEKKNIQLGMVKAVQFEPITMLYTKTLDIVSGVYWNIEPFQLQHQGVEVKYFTWEDFGLPDYPELVFISSQRFLEQHPTFSHQFRQAIQESIELCIEHPEEAFDLYLKHNPEKKHLAWEKSSWNATYPILAHSQQFDLERLEAFHRWLEDCKILSREFNVREILD